MSSADIAMVFQGAARSVRATESRPVLRIALYQGELVRIPRGRKHLHVLSGTAWISANACDRVAERGACISLAECRDAALVSGLGAEPLLFEVW
ncbi:MAG TPA: hypothetical protein VMV03_04955 [Spirochaetia bacterium]|nr:hypothetical protein [Spirochaetia bacterium]